MISYPKSLQYEITRAQLLIKTTPARMHIETEKRGFEITSYPLQMQVDNSAFFESLGFKSIETQAMENIQYSKNAIIKTMERYAMEKNAMLRPNGPTLGQLAAQRMHRTIQSALDFIPKSKPKISWTGGYVDVKYNKDIINISWEPGGVEYEYIPYSVEMKVAEWEEAQGLPENNDGTYEGE